LSIFFFSFFFFSSYYFPSASYLFSSPFFSLFLFYLFFSLCFAEVSHWLERNFLIFRKSTLRDCKIKTLNFFMSLIRPDSQSQEKVIPNVLKWCLLMSF
jgi:hypothetical protein